LVPDLTGKDKKGSSRRDVYLFDDGDVLGLRRTTAAPDVPRACSARPLVYIHELSGILC
jgi:hypothetical protein